MQRQKIKRRYVYIRFSISWKYTVGPCILCAPVAYLRVDPGLQDSIQGAHTRGPQRQPLHCTETQLEPSVLHMK